MAFTKKVVAGQTIAAADFAKFFGDHFSEFVKTGFEVTEGTGLVVDISAGTAYVKDASGYMYQIVSGATETATLADNSTNYVFLHSDNGATYITDSTTATVPDDAILLATVTTASGDVSEVIDERELEPLTKQEHLKEEEAILSVTTNQVSTTNEYVYFNNLSDRLITLRKIKYTFAITSDMTYTPSVTVKYSLDGGDNETTIRTITEAGTYTDTINVTSSDTSKQVYLKFTVTTSAGGTSTRTFTGGYFSYLTSY